MIAVLKMNFAGRNISCERASDDRKAARPSETQIAAWQHRLEAYLKDQGLKHSDQRWHMVRVILDAGGHLSAQQLLEEVHREFPSMGAATVYRNIKVLCDAKVLRETLVDPAGRPIFELYDSEHHDHIVCLDCGKITEFSDSKIEAAQTAVARSLGFEEVHHRHVIYARCTLRSRRKR